MGRDLKAYARAVGRSEALVDWLRIFYGTATSPSEKDEKVEEFLAKFEQVIAELDEGEV